MKPKPGLFGRLLGAFFLLLFTMEALNERSNPADHYYRVAFTFFLLLLGVNICIEAHLDRERNK